MQAVERGGGGPHAVDPRQPGHRHQGEGAQREEAGVDPEEQVPARHRRGRDRLEGGDERARAEVNCGQLSPAVRPGPLQLCEAQLRGYPHCAQPFPQPGADRPQFGLGKIIIYKKNYISSPENFCQFF